MFIVDSREFIHHIWSVYVFGLRKLIVIKDLFTFSVFQTAYIHFHEIFEYFFDFLSS